MKILQLIGTLDRGGVETMLMNMIRNGFKTDICVEIPDKGKYEDEAVSYGCQIYHLTKRSISMVQHHKDLYKIAKDYDTVHIHAQNAFLAWLEVKVIKKAGVKKVIVHSHNTKDWRNVGIGKILHLIARPFLRKSCIMTACSTEAGVWMFGTSNINLIPLPVDTAKFKIDTQKNYIQRANLGICQEFVLLHVGNFREAKNHMFLIDIMRALENKYPGLFLLLLAGSGPLQKDIQKAAEGLPVQFLGSIDNVSEVMMASNMFLLPSLNEGLPTVALEAQASGLPCLLSDHITKECKVTDLVQFLPLDVDEWITKIIHTPVSFPRERYADIVEKTNGIQITIQSFWRLYE